jgi:two-component system response regulator YesN
LNEENSQIQKKFDDFYHNARDYKLLLIHLKLQLEKNHKDVFVTLLKDATDILKKNVSINFPPAIEIYYGIALTLMTFININNIIDKIVFKINPMRMFMIPDFKSWDEAVKYLFDVSAAIFEIRTNNSQQTELNITLKIKSYINNNLSGDLSLVAIADKLGLNPCYISRHFKSVEGINISQYISLKKVEKAREFLKSKDIKIHEVAKLLGFDSNSYFTKFFRKEQGLSPQEYRNKFI